jgi:anthranilate phosphoribosyltransferase
MVIKEFIKKVVKGDDLTEREMEDAMDEIMSGKATPAQIGAFITSLRLKGETVDEITGAAREKLDDRVAFTQQCSCYVREERSGNLS